MGGPVWTEETEPRARDESCAPGRRPKRPIVAEQLQQALAVQSADQVLVQERPWLAARDLVAHPGLGQGLAAAGGSGEEQWRGNDRAGEATRAPWTWQKSRAPD